MVSNTSHSGTNRDSQLVELNFDEYTTGELEAIHDHPHKELDRRTHGTYLDVALYYEPQYGLDEANVSEEMT